MNRQTSKTSQTLSPESSPITNTVQQVSGTSAEKYEQESTAELSRACGPHDPEISILDKLKHNILHRRDEMEQELNRVTTRKLENLMEQYMETKKKLCAIQKYKEQFYTKTGQFQIPRNPVPRPTIDNMRLEPCEQVGDTKISMMSMKELQEILEDIRSPTGRVAMGEFQRDSESE